MKASDAAGLRLRMHEREVGGIQDDADALAHQQERLRTAGTLSVEDAAPVGVPERPAPPGATGNAGTPARQLAAVLRRETVAACRYIAAAHGIRLELPPDAPEDAADMTESFRMWLRAHWQEARPPEGVSR